MTPLITWIKQHPNLTSWIALSIGMVVILIWQGRDQNLLPTAWVALIVATVLVAGACVWIINWE